MKQVLISGRDDLMARWLLAFPNGKATRSVKQAIRVPKKQSPNYWLDLTLIDSDAWIETVDDLNADPGGCNGILSSRLASRSVARNIQSSRK